MSQDKLLLSLIICTYDRTELLLDSVKSVLSQLIDRPEVELIIVNNCPSSPVPNELKETIKNHPNVIIVEEPLLGLSHARNKGIRCSRGLWCGFLDDDARISEGYLSLVIKTILEEKYDCFGGGIASWWRYDKPRWLSQDFGSKPFLSPKEVLLDKDYLWGSNLIIKREVLLANDCFPTDVGMVGKKIGYGAETKVQKNLRDKGFKIGYIPELLIFHLVDYHKLKLSWHLTSAYATARDGKALFPEDYRLIGMVKTSRRLVAAPIKGFFHWITSSQYYWENWLLDSLKPWFILYGKFQAILF